MTVRRVLITTDAVGGVWTYSIELARALRTLGMEPVLASMGPSPSETQFAAAGETPVIDTGLPLDWLADGPDDVRAAAEAIAQLGEDVRADIIQLHSAAFACDVEFKQPVVAVQHSCLATWWKAVRGGALPHDLAWRRDLVQRGLRNCDAILAPSAAFGVQIVRTYGLAREVQTVPNGRTPLPLPERERERCNFALTVGRLWDDGKNVRTLDEAARMTTVPIEAIGPVRSPDGSPVAFHYLVIRGAADETEIAERLAARPIFASAAIYEPFGLSVLEAAQAGCALILSDIPTFRELWADAAMFVPAMDAQRFADAIASLLANPELRDAYGQAAQRRAAQYTPEATARGMIEIYEKLTTTPVCADIASAA
jgi:glycosyltransferase involved in cell wall biosynthesis